MNAKRTNKNLFQTALDKIFGKHIKGPVYEVTVIQKSDNISANERQCKFSSTSQSEIEVKESIIKEEQGDEKRSDVKYEENKDIINNPPKAPPRKRSRPSSRNSYRSVDLNSYQSSGEENKADPCNVAPTPPPRRRSRPSSQNSCRSFDLHNLSPGPPRPYRGRTYSQVSSISPKPPPRARQRSLTSKSNQNAKKFKDDLKGSLGKPPIASTLKQNDGNSNNNVPEKDLCKQNYSKSNSLIDLRWEIVKNSSRLSLQLPEKEKVISL